MNDMLVVALVWALPSYFLHCVIHEASHALVVRRLGGTILSVRLLPSWDSKLRKLTFASITYKTPPDLVRVGHLEVALAPVSIEYAWIGIMAVLSLLVPAPWVGVLIVEVLSSIVDLGVWHVGMLRNKDWTDGSTARRNVLRESRFVWMSMAIFCACCTACSFWACTILRSL